MSVRGRSDGNINHSLKFHLIKITLLTLMHLRRVGASSLSFFGVIKFFTLSVCRSNDLNMRCRIRDGVFFLERVILSNPETSSDEGDLTGVVSKECCLQTVSRSVDCGLNNNTI